MIIDRLKNVLKANVNAQIEKLKDNEYDLWKTYFDEDEHDTSYYQEDNFKDDYEQWDSSSQQDYSNTHNSTVNKEAEYYSDLELKPGATFKQIKSAYRRLVKLYHPDLFQNDPKKKEIADEVTRKINEAYNYFDKKFNSK